MADGDDEKPVLVSRRDVRKFIDSFRAEPRFKEVPINLLNNFFSKPKKIMSVLLRFGEVGLTSASGSDNAKSHACPGWDDGPCRPQWTIVHQAKVHNKGHHLEQRGGFHLYSWDL